MGCFGFEFGVIYRCRAFLEFSDAVFMCMFRAGWVGVRVWALRVIFRYDWVSVDLKCFGLMHKDFAS